VFYLSFTVFEVSKYSQAFGLQTFSGVERQEEILQNLNVSFLFSFFLKHTYNQFSEKCYKMSQWYVLGVTKDNHR